MTAALRPDTREAKPVPETPKSGLLTKEQLASPQLRTKEAEIPGRGAVKVRELTQYDRDEVEGPVMRQEADESGKMTVRRDERGYKVRAIAFALLNPDGSQMFDKPLEEGVKAINGWPTRWVDPVFDAVDELSILTRGARERLGKATGGTGGAGSSSK